MYKKQVSINQASLFKIKVTGEIADYFLKEIINIQGKISAISDKTNSAKYRLSCIPEAENSIAHLKIVIREITENKEGIVIEQPNKYIADYLINFNTKKTGQIHLNEKLLSYLNTVISTQKLLIFDKKLTKFQTQPKVYKEIEEVKENSPIYFSLYSITNAENFMREQYINFKRNIEPRLKDILPKAHYTPRTYYLEFNSDLQEVFTENFNPEHIIEINNKKYFIAENNTGKVELEKKVFNLLMSVYAAGLEKVITDKEEDLKIRSLIPESEEASDKEWDDFYTAAAKFYTSIAALTSLVTGEYGEASKKWIRKAEEKIKLAAPKILFIGRWRQERLKKRILQDFSVKYASKQSLAPQNTLPAKKRTIKEIAAISTQEIKLLNKLPDIETWEKLITVLINHQAKYQLDKSAEYHDTLLKAVEEAARENFSESFWHKQRYKAERELSVRNNFVLEEEVQEALIRGIDTAFRSNRWRDRILFVAGAATIGIVATLKWLLIL